MQNFTEKNVQCPHCNHDIKMTLDSRLGIQEFFDDCPACFHVIHLSTQINNQNQITNLFIDTENEQIF